MTYDVITLVSREFLRKAIFGLRKVYYISQQASLQFTTVQFITIHMQQSRLLEVTTRFITILDRYYNLRQLLKFTTVLVLRQNRVICL